MITIIFAVLLFNTSAHANQVGSVSCSRLVIQSELQRANALFVQNSGTDEAVCAESNDLMAHLEHQIATCALSQSDLHAVANADDALGNLRLNLSCSMIGR